MPGIWFYGLRCHLFRGFLDTDMCVSNDARMSAYVFVQQIYAEGRRRRRILSYNHKS